MAMAHACDPRARGRVTARLSGHAAQQARARARDKATDTIGLGRRPLVDIESV